MAESVSSVPSSRPSPRGCAVWLRQITVTNAGVIRLHGPVGARCPGSGQPPGQPPGTVLSQLAQASPVGGAAVTSHRAVPMVSLPPRPSAKVLKRVPKASPSPWRPSPSSPLFCHPEAFVLSQVLPMLPLAGTAGVWRASEVDRGWYCQHWFRRQWPCLVTSFSSCQLWGAGDQECSAAGTFCLSGFCCCLFRPDSARRPFSPSGHPPSGLVWCQGSLVLWP